MVSWVMSNPVLKVLDADFYTLNCHRSSEWHYLSYIVMVKLVPVSPLCASEGWEGAHSTLVCLSCCDMIYTVSHEVKSEGFWYIRF